MQNGLKARKPILGQFYYNLMKLSGYGILYGLSLYGKTASAPKINITNIWHGDSKIGKEIFEYGFKNIQSLNSIDKPTHANQHYNDYFNFSEITKNNKKSNQSLCDINSFAWLTDLAAIGKSDEIAKQAQHLCKNWIEANKSLTSIRKNQIAWRGDITARRIFAWLQHWQIFFDAGELNFRHDMLKSIARQIRHLRNIAAYQPLDDGNITAIKGWLCACLILKSEETGLVAATEALDWVLAEQIFADGGHISRNPEKQLSILQDLIDIRLVFRQAKVEIPQFLQATIDRMSPMLRFYRHPDKSLTVFNGGNSRNKNIIDMTLSYAEARGIAPKYAPHSGYQKLLAGDLCVFIDMGNPPYLIKSNNIFASALAIEVSAGQNRIFVNCGKSISGNKQWRQSERSTAAHSTLCLANCNSTDLSNAGKRHAHVTSKYTTKNGNHWIDASHDGYKKNMGIIHKRRLFMAHHGNDLRGEDIIEGPANIDYNISFHLHPKVKISILHNQKSALLKLSNGDAWRLRISGADIKLTDSIYFGDDGKFKRNQQIILSGITQVNKTSIKWALRQD